MANNLLTLPPKLTKPIPGLANSLVQHVADSFDTTHPDAIRQDAEGLEQQRVWLFGREDGVPPPVSENALRRMLAYYAQLSFAVTKLPLDVSISFPWYPIFTSSITASISVGAFSSSVAISLPNLQYERLSVLYNIAAMHSVLGVQASRSDAAGIKSSIASFQNAAGTLDHLLTLLPLLHVDPPALNPPSPDMSVKAIEAMRDICLAQAQEAFWQKGVMDRLKNGTIAKLSAKVSEYYSMALTEATDAKGADGAWPLFGFPSDVLNHLVVKSLHFAAASQYRKSIDDGGANRYGEEVARLRQAQVLVKKAMDGSRKGVAAAVISDLKSLQAVVNDNVARATKDNDLIYLDPVPLPSSLSPIVPAAMVKPTPPAEVVSPLSYLHNAAGGLGRPLFEALIPYEVHLAAKVYEDRKERLLVEDLVERKNELDSQASLLLQSLNLPAAVEAILQPIGPPASLLQKAQDVRSQGGSSRMKSTMSDVRQLAQENQKILDETLEILAREESEDTAFRSQYGTDRWTRQPSRSANPHLRERADNLGAIIAAAGKSDALVRAKFGEHELQIGILGSSESTLAHAIPKLATPTLMGGSGSSATTTIQSSTLRSLRRTLDELEDLRTMRNRTIIDARKAIAEDDARPAIMREANVLAGRKSSEGAFKLTLAEFEEVMERELEKFRVFKVAVAESAGRQADVLDRIKTANESFLRARRSDPKLKSREKALQDLDTAYYKYSEISINLQEGLKFYTDFAKLLVELRDGCKQWAYQRSEDGRDVVGSLTQAMEGVRVDTPTQGVYDPATHGGIRFG